MKQLFEELYGVPSWNVHQGWGSFVTAEFGQPVLDVEQPAPRRPPGEADGSGRVTKRWTSVRGSWHLWVYCCAWVLWNDDVELAHWECDRDEIARALWCLDGQALTLVTIDPDDGATDFVFDLGGKLSTWPYDDPDDPDGPSEQWLLFGPKGEVLTVRSDGSYSRTTASSNAEETWRPLRSDLLG